MPSFLRAPRTGNGVADPNTLKRLENSGNAKDNPGVVSVKSQTFASLNPPIELAHSQFSPMPVAGLLPAVAGAPGVAGLVEYLSNPGAPQRDIRTLFHARPPTSQAFPRAIDSENAWAAPPRVRMPEFLKVFNRPRRDRPGSNPTGVNNTATG